MFAGRSTYSVLAFFLLFLAVLPAQGQSGHELRCRGRGGAFTVERVDGNTSSMRFTAGARAAGADGAGLEPGTCSFVDRTIESAEPLQVRFSATGPQLSSLTQELDDPYAYWCFFVASGAKAYFKAGEQRSCTCGDPVADEKSGAGGANSLASGAAAGKPASGGAAGKLGSGAASAKLDSVAAAFRDASGGKASGAESSGVRSSTNSSASQVSDDNAAKDKAVKDDKTPKNVVDSRPPVITAVSAIHNKLDKLDNLAFGFKTFANIEPLVEVSTYMPERAPDGRWVFPVSRPADKIEQTFLGTGPTVSLASGIMKMIAGGNKSLGEYKVELKKALDPGIVYYYIISVKNPVGSDTDVRQIKGIIHTPGANKYQVRYRGFFSDSANSTVARDIYAVVSTSYIFPTGDPAILSTLPSQVVRGVAANEAHPDSGTRVYQGVPADVLLTVTLMENKGGDPNKYKTSVHEAFLNEVGRLLVSPTKVGGALKLVSDAVNGAKVDVDSVIATSSVILTAAEMKAMANKDSPKSTDRGITYDFFTEHSGTIGAYRVYFDVVAR